MINQKLNRRIKSRLLLTRDRFVEIKELSLTFCVRLLSRRVQELGDEIDPLVKTYLMCSFDASRSPTKSRSASGRCLIGPLSPTLHVHSTFPDVRG